MWNLVGYTKIWGMDVEVQINGQHRDLITRFSKEIVVDEETLNPT